MDRTVKRLEAHVSPQEGAASLQRFDARVRSLSNNGLSLELSPDDNLVLSETESLEVSLRAPDSQRSYSIACVVSNRMPLDDVVVYYCDYDWSATMDPLGVVEDLAEYLLD